MLWILSIKLKNIIILCLVLPINIHVNFEWLCSNDGNKTLKKNFFFIKLYQYINYLKFNILL